MTGLGQGSATGFALSHVDGFHTHVDRLNYCRYKNLRGDHDPVRNELNKANHGFDIAGLSAEFFLETTILPANLGRFRAVGEWGGKVVTVVFRPLGSEAFAVISIRRASRKERNAR